MKVKLLHYTPLEVAIKAIRICYNSINNSDSKYYSKDTDLITEFKLGEKDSDLIKRIIKNDHTSTIEHINFTFEIEDVSRSLTHQLVRHRIASYSQQSQRHVKLNTDSFPFVIPDSIKRNEVALSYYTEMIEKIKDTYKLLIDLNIKKEDARYLLPNATYTSLIMTMNARSLRNFFKERLSKQAQWEIRSLAEEMLLVLPNEYNILFEDYKNRGES